MALLRATKSRVCPVCNTGTKGCSHDTSTGVYLCRGTNISSEFRYVKEKDGFGVYVKGKSNDQRDWQKYEQERLRREIEETKRFARLLSVDDRHNKITALLEELPLLPKHEEDLKKRGLPKELALQLGFRSIRHKQKLSEKYYGLPGFNEKGTFWGQSGYLCLTRSYNNKFTGYQIKVDKDSQGKYVWTKYKDISAHLRNRELPLNYVHNESKIFGLCEGILKPTIAAQKHTIKMLGASGGNFTPLQLKEVLNSRLNPEDELVLFPDAGFASNGHVMRQITKLVCLVEDLGYELKFADWGHWFNKSKKDIDELENLDGVKFIDKETALCYIEDKKAYQDTQEISLDHYELQHGIPALMKGIHNRRYKPNQGKIELFNDLDCVTQDYVKDQLPKPEKGLPMFEFDGLATEIYQEASRQGFKYVLDISQTGAGKTFAAGEIEPEECFLQPDNAIEKPFYKVINLTKSPRNPNVEKLESEFTELPARNNGYDYDRSQFTPLGNPFRVQTKDKENPEIQSNCHLTDYFQVVRSQNVDFDICKKCELASQCKTSQGKGFGYKKQVQDAVKSDKIIGNPGAVTTTMVNDNTLLIVDEYTQSVEWVETFELDFKKISDGCAFVYFAFKDHDVDFNIDFLSSLIKTMIQKFSDFRFGKGLKDIQDMLPKHFNYEVLSELAQDLAFVIDDHNSRIITKNLKKKKKLEAGMIAANWLLDFIEIATGKNPNGSLLIKNDKLYIYKRNERILGVFDKAHTTIFQDATGSAYDLSLKLGCDPSEILVIRQKQSRPDNVEFTHIKGMGAMGNQRSKSLKERVKLIRREISDRHPSVGFIEWKQHQEDGDLTHLSTGRGSNVFQEKNTVVSLGIPRSNLGASLCEYEVFTGQVASLKDEGFTLYHNNKVGSELVQEVGRLRANRRKEETVNYYLVGDCDTTFFKNMGYQVNETYALDFCFEAADRTSKARVVIADTVKEMLKETSLEELKQKDLANEINMKTSNLSRLARKFGGWIKFKKVLAAFIYGDGKHYVDDLYEDKDEIQWMAKVYLPDAFLHDLNTEGEDSEVMAIANDLGDEYFYNLLHRIPVTKVVEILKPVIQCLPYQSQVKFLNICGNQ